MLSLEDKGALEAQVEFSLFFTFAVLSAKNGILIRLLYPIDSTPDAPCTIYHY
jgi:hypothetical protein